MDVAAGDWFVGQAAASAIVLHPFIGEIQIFNAHASNNPSTPISQY